MKHQVLLLAAFSTVLYSTTQAKTITALSCSEKDVQAAIHSASNGDTVKVPPGSCTWTSTVTISNSQQITLAGTDSTTITFNGGYLDVTAGMVSNTFITGFIFNGSYTNGDSPIAIHTFMSPPSLTFRFHHNLLNGGNPSGPATFINTDGNGPGLIDHNTFSCSHGADEMVHVDGNGAVSDSGWTNAVVPGGADMTFLEDNVFIESSAVIGSAFQSYYGARTVARHNTFTNAQIDQHGGGGIGARWWEFYNNNSTDGVGYCIRAGSGVIFANTNVSAARMVQETGVYPADYQVGRGQNETLNPAYVWSNVNMELLLNTNSGCANGEANMIQLNCDVYQADSGSVLPGTCAINQSFWRTDEKTLYKCTSTNKWTTYYKPYCYPHPLVTGSNCTAFTDISNQVRIDKQIQIYPNPASNNLIIINSDAVFQIQDVLILNLTGSIVWWKNNFCSNCKDLTIDVSNLSNGIYFVQLKNPQGETVTKKMAVIHN